MERFFNILKKSIVATMFILFATVFTYVPQDWNAVERAHAGAAGGGATEWTQLAQFAQDAAYQIKDLGFAFDNVIQNTISAVSLLSLEAKEYVLDGGAWIIAKQAVSIMVDSLVDWIRSGFKGRPQFVENLKQYLVEVADQAVGEFISNLGSAGSFICSPFRLDVSIALNVQYQEIIRKKGEQPVSKCTLTGIIDNIKGFTSGLPGSFSENGGWDDWFDITSEPMKYTEYGAFLSAEAGMRASIVNAEGQEVKLLDFGDGFLSGKVCEVVHGADTAKEECFINKPGKIIEEALSFHLDTGRQSLVTADEIQELLGALITYVANEVLEGASGLL